MTKGLGEEQPPKLSLVVATVDRTEPLRRLFESLASQSSSAFEVILVDQNPDGRVEPYAQLAQEMGIKLLHIRLPKRDQYVARTTGLKAATGRYVAFPDDDCWYEPSTVERALWSLECSRADCVIAKWDERDSKWGNMPFVLTWKVARTLRIPGTAMFTQFYKASSVTAFGGFDDRFGIGRWYSASEDIDLLLSLVHNGMTCVFAPTIVIRHKFDRNRFERSAGEYRELRGRARGNGALYAKYPVPLWVILREIFGPPITALVPHWSMRSFRAGLTIALGKFEGYLNWRIGRHFRTTR